MDDAAWARHANPLSVYSRIGGGPFVFLALWSPFWLGLWGALPIALAFAWLWLNPRLFQPPQNTETWACRAVLGERAFLNRASVAVPEHHRRAAHFATALAALFMLISAAGFFLADFWLAFTAWHAAIIAKLWFCDRMVWLWQDIKECLEMYRAWDQADWR